MKARSRYEEDVHPNNHTSVWGSWWRDGAWGYACCHQAVKNSYCTGKVGEEADGASVDAMMAANLANKAAEAEEARRKAEAEGKPRLEGHKPKVRRGEDRAGRHGLLSPSLPSNPFPGCPQPDS